MSRTLAPLMLVLVGGLGAVAVAGGSIDEPVPTVTVVVERPVPDLWKGKRARWWGQRNVYKLQPQIAKARRYNRRLERELRRRFYPSSYEALTLASIAYGVPLSTLVRRADCETGGTFSPFARNEKSDARGLLQFIPSTWRSTPYAHLDPYSPYANALAAGWMHGPAGRSGEWECR